MKNLVFLLMVAVIITSCTNEPRMESPGDDPSAKTLTTKAEQLITKAQQARALFYPSQSRSISADATIEYVVSRNSRSEADTLLSITNFADNQGFVIMTDKAEVPEFLAVSDIGNVKSENNDNPGLQNYLNNAIAALSNIGTRRAGGSTPLDPTRPFLYEIEDVYDTIVHVDPMIDVRWGQSPAPYNAYCPLVGATRTLAGCTPIAVAQTMTHFEHPKSLYWNLDGTATTIPLNWAEIKKHKGNMLLNIAAECSDNQASHEAIGKLVRKLGHIMNSQYGVNGTSTYFDQVRPALQSFGYTVSEIQTFPSSKKFDGSGIWLISGGSENQGRHTFIVDGRTYLKHYHREYYLDPMTLPPTIIDVFNEYTKYYDFLHINWGWDGLSNGYFYYGTFNTSKAYNLDYPSSAGTDYDFNVNIRFAEVSL